MNNEINAGYMIIDKTRIGNVEIALAHRPTAVQPYVTWNCRTNTGDYYWGHYFTKEADARNDYAKRIKQEKSRHTPER